ncbi:MAG: carbamoyltransferase HypF [Verrucomicrobiae bacterium]|nr:carbamoyltransferase HypF [Verrucomicrobiae bacterium]
MRARLKARIVGRVQGVGFRPTVYRYATELGLAGFVRNDPQGVLVEIEGEPKNIEAFMRRLQAEPPPQALITRIETTPMAPHGDSQFEVCESETTGHAAVHISPDLATCEDCLRELENPRDRRFGYPFINCTNCGPRFTIIHSLPYDRPNTSMATFIMCQPCSREYHNPADRRFHAQPNACEKCGPRLGMEIDRAVALLRAGKIVAIKSLGGFHLACLPQTAQKLRERKHRPHKPFAVMFRDIAAVKRCCEVSEAEEAELLSVARPIVILKAAQPTRLTATGQDKQDGYRTVSPDSPTIGAFLPYTPIHHLLMQHFEALVMTSGNLTEEPIASDEAELPPVADAVLTHDRPILHKCDDSVVRIVNGQRQFFRRARGFVPNAIRFADDCPHLLAVGGELKNTFCLARNGWAFLSQHIGDLKDYKTHLYFTHEIAEWQRLMRVAPVAIAHDMHPDYRSTRWALQQNVPLIPVQHHHAHIASVMAEHNLCGDVIGVALDGTGYGPDGTVWGGEFLVATRAVYERVAHFKPYPLPGGEKAIEEPWRMAVSVLATEGLATENVAAPAAKDVRAVEQLVRLRLHSPAGSSAGRLFDAVAAILGLCDVATYEAQAAIRLESAADPSVSGHYPFDLQDGILDFGRAIAALLHDRGNVPLAAARFHNTIVAGIVRVCEWIRSERGLARVALSGGVFQNEWILTRTTAELRERGFEVFTNTQVPPNDGGLALGQIAVAAARCLGEASRLPGLQKDNRAGGATESPRCA